MLKYLKETINKELIETTRVMCQQIEYQQKEII